MAGSNYSVFNVNRKSCRGGGVALLFKSKLKEKLLLELVLPCLECLGVEIILYRRKSLVIAGYRPPSGSVNHLLGELSSSLSENTTMYSNVVIMGDFNIALNKNGPHQLKFTYLKEEDGLLSVHSEATTSKGNLLDFVLINKDVSVDLNIDKTRPSDHYAITFNMVFEKLPRERYVWKSVNHFEFAESIMLVFDEIISLEKIQNSSFEFISREMDSEEVFNFVNNLYDCFYLSAISVRDKLVSFKRFLVLSN